MSIIKLKRSDTAAVSPTGLAHGEVAVNITDKKIFIGNSTGGTVLLVDGNATGGVSSFNTRTGAVSLTYSDVTTALGFTPISGVSTETIQDAAASLFTTGTHTGISVSYPDTNNAINLVNTGVLSIGGLTGVISAAAGRTSLGLVIDTDVQRYDPTLAAIAGLSPDTDDLIYFNGTDGASITTLTSFGRSLIDDVSATTARTTLGLTIGTNVQAWDADLDAIAALNGSTGVLKKTGSNAWSIDTDTYWKDTNDGASSGLDADLIRGVAGQRFVENLQTGILYGGIISVNAGNPATVDITAGAGIVVTPGASLTAMPAPVVTNVTWAAQTAVALPQIANYDETWISFSSSGVVTLRNVAWTDAQYASEIPIGAVYHVNRSSVNLVKNYPHVAYGQADQMDPFLRAFGPLKLSGHEISANGANLSVNRTSGTAYAIGRNYQTDPNNPNVVTDSSATPASVVYRFYRNAGTGYTTVINSVIDPDFYDDGTGTLHATGNTRWQIQRIFYLPNQTNTIGVYYGTIQYTNLDDAQFGLLTETFAESESTATQGIFLGYLLLKGNCTDLSDTARAKFVQAGLFRNVSSGGGSGLLTTSIDDLSDVVITSAANDNLLRYSGGQWVNSTIGSLGISTLTGIETLTNKTLTSPTISNLYLSDGLILVEGTTNDSNEMSLVVSSLTADRTITFPNATGSVITTGNLTSITSTGTIASGTWQGTAIADSYISSATTWNTAYTDRNKWDGGATGLTAATGRTSLGLDIGTNVQAYNATLSAVAAGTYTGTNTITTLGTVGTGTWQGTAIADTYISSATTWNTASTDRFKWDGGATGLVAATGRTSLGLAIGSDVQGYNATLATVAGGTYTGSTSITTLGTVGTGTWQGTAIADTYISSATTWNTASTDRFKWDGGATGLVAGTGRTSLGLGSVENTAISTWAGSTNITTLGTVGTGTWNGTAIGATKGGTGQTTYATGDLIYSSASDTLSKLTKPAATTSFLQMTSAGIPSWQTTIPATAGGTGSTAAFTSGALVYASSTSVLTTGTVFGITSSSTVNSVKITSGASPKSSQYFSVTESLLGSAATLGLETDATPGVPATTSSAYLNLASSQTTSAIYMSASTGNDVTISAGGSGEAFSIVASASELYGTLVGVVKVVDDAISPYVLFGDDGSIFGGDHCLIKMEAVTAILTIDSTTVQIYTTTPVAGKVLTCMDGSGTVSWETPSSARGWFL